MKLLYAVQGTGNGHVSRAREIIPILQEFGEIDVLLSGTQVEVDLPVIPKYQFSGLGFVFGNHGGVDFWKTCKEFHFAQFFKNIRELPVNEYDLVINDFEPVTAWACKFKNKKSIALSHQSSFLSPKVPMIKGLHWGRLIMNNYAPSTHFIGFHFKKFDQNIYTPVIRSEVRNLKPENHGHYTVYLPAYSDEFVLDQIKSHPNIKWQIFSKKTKKNYNQGNAEVHPIQSESFIKSLEKCTGLLTGGGFEGPAEALFLGKKLLSVPMKNQYEQQCNALALEEMGVPIIWKEDEFSEKLTCWIQSNNRIPVEYPDETRLILKKILVDNIFKL